MRLIYLCLDQGVPIGGAKGAAIHVEAITSALASAGHRVQILAARTAPNGQSSCPVEVLPLDAGIRAGLKATADLVARHLPDYHLDRDLRAILANATLVSTIAERLRTLGADVVLERLSLFGIAGLEAARAADIPHALEVNAPLAREALDFRGLATGPLAATIERHVLTETDLVLPVSMALGAHCRELGVPGERIAVVPNGVDLDRFTPTGVGHSVRTALGLAPEDCVIGMASGLRPWHGGRDLARAFVEVAPREPRARLLVVGDGPERLSMEEFIDGAGLAERTRFTGWVPHRDVPAYMEAMDVAVAPYRPMAGFYFSPLKIYEYMAMGLAITGPSLGQIREVIEDRINGRLTRPGDTADLARVILELLGDETLRRQLGLAARQTAEELHGWSHAAERITLHLEALIDKAGATEPAHATGMSGVEAGQEGRGQAPDPIRQARARFSTLESFLGLSN